MKIRCIHSVCYVAPSVISDIMDADATFNELNGVSAKEESNERKCLVSNGRRCFTIVVLGIFLIDSHRYYLIIWVSVLSADGAQANILFIGRNQKSI